MTAVSEEVKVAIVNFAIKELSESTSNHVYNFVKSEVGASRHHIFTALLAAKDNAEKHKKLKQKRSAEQKQKQKVGLQVPVPVNYESLISCSDAEFKRHFRMKRKTIDLLANIIGKRLSMAMVDNVHPLVPVKKKILLTIWLLGNNQSYMAAAKLFKLAKGTVYRVFHQICSELIALAGTYIYWPDPDECDEISLSFENRYGFPGVIGVIGACHVEIREPESKEEAKRFKNEQTGQYTIILQAVCDDKLFFRDICAGFPGETSKSRVLVGSPLYSRLSSRTDPLIDPHKHVLGSSDYPQLSTLLTPYSSSASGRPLTKQEQKFNRLHHTVRSVVEQCFVVLKRRFPRLRFIDVTRMELANKVVVAACVLHNFALLHGDELTGKYFRKTKS